jgi:WhiB family redox-sensing transcriptional regulator
MVNALETLIASLAGAPALPGARCRGRHHLFDPAAPGEAAPVVEQRHAQALGLCSHCPSLDRCQDWVDSLPKGKKPFGVVAGAVRMPRQPAAGENPS